VTHVTVGARTSDPLHRRRALYLKSYLDNLLLAIRNFYLGRQAGRHNSLLEQFKSCLSIWEFPFLRGIWLGGIVTMCEWDTSEGQFG